MDDFAYTNGQLHAEGVPVDEIATKVGTPTFVYSSATLLGHYRRLTEAFGPLDPAVCFAVKSCGNPEICRLIAGAGAGFDVVSVGELERVWLSGAPMSGVVFAGVGKRRDEMLAALDGRYSPLAGAGVKVNGVGPEGRGPIGLFNVESEQELEVLEDAAKEAGVVASATLRVNPDVDARTHRHTTTGKRENKFGIDLARAPAAFDRFGDSPHVNLRGLHMHLGSPIYSPDPYTEALERILARIDEIERRGHRIDRLNIGGGIGADYETGATPPYTAYAERIVPMLAPLVDRGVKILMEPGRTLIANAGVLLVRVEYVKETSGGRFVVCDAGMNALIRPALYDAFHFVWPVRVGEGQAPARRSRTPEGPGLVPSHVVGPICESADAFVRDWPMPRVERGDLLAVFSAGAYGMSMASTYNDHPLPAEVLVEGGKWRTIRPRQSVAAMLLGPEACGGEAGAVEINRADKPETAA